MADATNVISVKKCLTFHDCARLPIFSNFGWDSLYKKNILNMIKMLDIYNDIFRLYLLACISEPYFDGHILITKRLKKRIRQHPDALRLTCSLKDIMPDVDPIYLDLVGEVYAFDENGLLDFIEEITKQKRTYPKLQEYNAKVQDSKVIKSLRVNFKVEEFVQLCPDPETYFKRNKSNSKKIHYHESLSYLANRFNMINMESLIKSLNTYSYNLTNTVKFLKANSNQEKNKNIKKTLVNYCKPDVENFMTTNNIEFLKEITFLDHKEDILNFLKSKKFIHQEQVKEAKSLSQELTCECCYNEDLLDNEVCCCPAGHFFCSLCIKKSIELAVGSCKLEFKCLTECSEEFNLSLIKTLIDDKMYKRILRLKQTEEIKAAGIEGLETCAFCEYSVILSSDFKVINCLNPECKKETCRKCRQENHLPLRCDQVDVASVVKIRTMIENKMTEVLVRTCNNCKRKFIKEDGCNKMTCRCGYSMCYICRQPVDNKNYVHYYHDTVIKDLCPLYTDENVIRITAVEAAARLIINELKVSQPEILKNIDINRILPDIKKWNHDTNGFGASSGDVNELVATLIGQDVEDVNNLTDMRKIEPSSSNRPSQ